MAAYYGYPADDDAPYRLVWRVGVGTAARADPPQTTSKIKIGNSTRNAVSVPSGSWFEVPVDGDGLLLFSFGGRDVSTAPGAIFTIRARVQGRWRKIFREGLPRAASQWIDRKLDLHVVAPGASALQFETVAPPAGEPEDDLFWGSVTLLKRPSQLATAWSRWTGRSVPSVVLISLDTLGADHMGAASNDADVSPHLDRFLHDNFAFRRAYAQYPNTLVSHASMFTGQFPKHHGVYSDSPELRTRTLASMLAEEGYLTNAITEDAYVDSGFGFDAGFDRYDDGDGAAEAITGNAQRTFDRATEWLDDFPAHSRFFLFVHTYEVHAPYAPRDAQALAIANRLAPNYRGAYATSYEGGMTEIAHNAEKRLVEGADRARLRALYRGEISYLDRVVGRFLDHLAALPNADQILVVVTSDHGEEFGEHGKLGHGETLHNEALHVPLALAWPGHVVSGTNDMPVQTVDIVPTILDLTQSRPGEHVDGNSLAPILTGRGSATPRPAYAEMRFIPFAVQRAESGECADFGLPPDCRVDRRAVQTERFKLIRSKFPSFELLYDLQGDPGEAHDVLQEFPGEAQQLRELLQKYDADSGAIADKPAPPPATLDSGTRERLRALGYVQ